MKEKSKMVKLFFFCGLMIIMAQLSFQNAMGMEPKKLIGQTVYVPVYSHIILGERRKAKIKFDLSFSLSIRNTDPKNPITIIAVDYYDSDGTLVKKFVSEPTKVKPLASTYFFIKQSDSTGGWGANFIVEWKSEKKANEPIIEGVTFGARGSHSISFISRGKAIEEVSRN